MSFNYSPTDRFLISQGNTGQSALGIGLPGFGLPSINPVNIAKDIFKGVKDRVESDVNKISNITKTASDNAAKQADVLFNPEKFANQILDMVFAPLRKLGEVFSNFVNNSPLFSSIATVVAGLGITGTVLGIVVIIVIAFRFLL